MAYQTLYRKYRPKTFDYVYGQDTIVKTLKNVVKNDKLSHAYLFTGPRGTGKTSCAKLFAKTINCLNNVGGDACNECDNCVSFNENSNPDIIEIDAASNNGVDEIREIRNKVNLVPSFSKYKVYIIDEVHMLSIGAFNALLKTLEEPPKYIIFILATTEPQKLPTTIISRCQRFDFKSISPIKMEECLKNIVEKEKINIENDAIYEIINNSKGGMRDAIGMLDQAYAFSDENIKLKDVQDLSGNVSDDEITEFVQNIIDSDYKNMLGKTKEWTENGKDFALITQKIINFIRNGILYKKNVIDNQISDKAINIYKHYSDSKLYQLIDCFGDLLTKIQNNFQKELIFEVDVIKIVDEINGNVSRETLLEETKKPEQIKNGNVSRETHSESQTDLIKKINNLKEIRINNILKLSTKEKFKFVSDLWQNLNDYLIDSSFKNVAGALLESNLTAASSKGLIISAPSDAILNKLEEQYDLSKELLKKLLNQEYKVVYITTEYWKKIRPEYVEKAKNNQLELKDEEYLLSQINKIKNENSVNEFDDLIEMEEK